MISNVANKINLKELQLGWRSICDLNLKYVVVGHDFMQIEFKKKKRKKIWNLTYRIIEHI